MNVQEVLRRRLGLLNAGMALAYLPLAILIMFSDNYVNSATSTSDNTTAKATNPILDPKRRNDLVDEAFLEQKDILLSMLENKLKEVRDKKKKKADRSDTPNEENTVVTNKCDILPNNVDLKLKSSGMVGVGETDLQLKFGESGNNILDLNATGISNVGKINMKLGVGDGTLQIPGLNDLFHGSSPFLKGPCLNQNKLESDKQNNEDKIEAYVIQAKRKNLELPTGSFNESLSNITNNETTTEIDSTSTNLQENATESIFVNTKNVDETIDM